MSSDALMEVVVNNVSNSSIIQTMNNGSNLLQQGFMPLIPKLQENLCYNGVYVNSFFMHQVHSLQYWNYALSIAAVGLVLLSFAAEQLRMKKIKELEIKIVEQTKVIGELRNSKDSLKIPLNSQETSNNAICGSGCGCHDKH